MFTPGLAPLFARVVSLNAAQAVVLVVPVALAWGCGLDALLRGLGRLGVIRQTGLWWMVAGLLVAAILLLYLEPVPIPASGRDQIRAVNQVQSLRDIHPADEQLLAALAAVVPPDRRSTVLTANRVANYVAESVPRALVVGGRGDHLPFAARFFTEGRPAAPWLDAVDLAFIREWEVTHIVVEADDTRLPQLWLQPDRFTYRGGAAGYLIFEVQPDISPRATDELFAAMNERYSPIETPRWGPDGIELVLPGDPAAWEPIAARWGDLLARDEGDAVARYGLAFTHLLMGDERALPLWQQLHRAYPELAQFTDVLAHTRRLLGDPGGAAETLLDSLDARAETARVLAARTLLTEPFFYLLDAGQVQQVISAVESAPVVWDQLAVRDRYEAVRERAALLMCAGEWGTAADWLAGLPPPEVSPTDMVTRAMALLARGDVEGALAALRPATEPDLLASRVWMHPDRWQNNRAAQVYHLLLGNIAQREGRWTDAEAAYRRAMAEGSTWAGRYFLAQTLAAAGRSAEAAALLAEVDADWLAVHGGPFPELVPLLAIADSHALYALDVAVLQDDAAHALTVWATYGMLGGPFPVATWRVQVASRDATLHYATADAPALPVDGALVRLPVTVSLPGDLPPLTQARVFVEPRHNNFVTCGPAMRDVVLNRPESVLPGPEAVLVERRFGPDIVLHSYEAGLTDSALSVTLYWRAEAVPSEDYQVFVHVLDETGRLVAQDDSAPVNNRYPTSQWRQGTLIADRHFVTFQEPLLAGVYQVWVGLYRLPDVTRLPIAPADERVDGDRFLLYTWERP